MMDLQSALVCVVVFIVSAAVLLLISMFGMKEKSYEEALAEQRQQNNGLLGPQTKPKSKEKKQKKAGKKVKEKQVTIVENEQTEELETTDSPATETTGQTALTESEHHLHNLHVDFVEPTVILEQPQPQVVTSKKRSKKDRVRPILIHHKDEKPLVATDEVVKVTTTNHFEQIHPKDEFERLHSHSPPKDEAVVTKTEAPAPAPVKEKSKKQKNKESKEDASQEKPVAPSKSGKLQNQSVSQQQQKQQVQHQPAVKPVEEVVKVEAAPPVTAAPTQNNPSPTTNIVKDKKKKKGEINTLQQLSGDRQSVNESLLMPLVCKAELSRSEIQILIDVLLNKQQEASAFHDEWSEGKADPVQKLKRQLAEKEKALSDKEETLAGAQAKLREIRTEYNAERAQLHQKVTNLEEALQKKQLEFKSINQQQQQKIQQLQTQLGEESLAVRKLREEQNGMQMQRSKMEMHMSTINEQTQEKEAQLAQLRAEIQDLQARNNQLSLDLHSYNEQTQVASEHNQGLITQLELQIRQCESQAMHFKAEAEDSARKMEEMRAHVAEVERRLNGLHRQENDLNSEVTRLTNCLRQKEEESCRFQQIHQKTKDEIAALQQKNEDNDRIVAQLRSELVSLQSEKLKLEAANANGNVAENKAHELEIMNLHNELDSLKSQKQQQLDKITKDLETSRKSVETLQKTLDEQIEKNNELRKKNWKVMDALNAAEQSLRTKSLPTTVSPSVNKEDAITQGRLKEQIENRKLLQRIFPEVEVSSSASQEQWLDSLEHAFKQRISEKQKATVCEEPMQNGNASEVIKLQSQIAHYKTIIDDTEGILNKLQKNVEEEETRWRTEIERKEKEIDSLKLELKNKLRVQATELEGQLNEERKTKQALIDECKALKKCSNINEVEKLTEEVNRLQEMLATEQSRSKQIATDLPVTKTAQLHNLNANGTAVMSESPTLSTSSSTASSLADDRPRLNKNKKKKGVTK